MSDIPKKDPEAYVMYLVVNTELAMSPGKIAAQVGHAVMEITELQVSANCYIESDGPASKDAIKRYDEWERWRENCRKVVLKSSRRQWDLIKELPNRKVVIVDAGYTEIAPNSETVIGFWPMKKVDAPNLIKKLQVL